jgi:hypothetical protein
LFPAGNKANFIPVARPDQHPAKQMAIYRQATDGAKPEDEGIKGTLFYGRIRLSKENRGKLTFPLICFISSLPHFG